MAKDTSEVIGNYVNSTVELLKPNKNYAFMKANIERAHAALEKYKLSQTEKKEREKKFNQIAAVYVGGAFGAGFDSHEVAGSHLKSYFNKLPDGSEALSRAYNAIERGDKVGLEAELKRALEFQGGNKLETLATEVRDQPTDIRMGVYGGIAKLLADVDGYHGDPVNVAENFTGALGALGQRLATADAFGKPKSTNK